MTHPPADALERERTTWRSADALALHADAARALLAGELAYALPSADGGAEDAGYTLEHGVAVVSIVGSLLSGGGWYWDGYESIATRVEHAHSNPAVRAVLLSINSPGGVVAGMLDGMRALRAARAQSGKRMVAWVGSGAYSAAYGLASTCDEIVLDELAGVGSIGVIDTMCSRVGEFEKAGLDVRVIASGSEKTDGHPGVEITPEAEARKRERVQRLAEAFAREIATGRPALSAEAALALDGGLRFGRAAVADALADRLSTRAALLAELAATPARTLPSGPRGAAPTDPTPPRNPTMDDKIAALIAAKTQETDPERQLGALTAMFDAAARAPALEAQLREKEAAEKAAHEAADKAARASAFEAALTRGQDEAKLTPAEAEQWRADFARGEVTVGVLEGNLARRAAIPALSPEHKALRPPAPLPPSGGLRPRVAELAARDYATLTWNERNELACHAADLHERLYQQWVADGRPRAAAAPAR